MSMGEILRTARQQRALSTSTAAESTHMKVQIIEDLENEDFRRIAAPIYGRGFVKLYAEFLELDAAPLIREFMDLYTGKRAPAVGRRPVDPAPAPAEQEAPVPVTRTVRQNGATKAPPLSKPLVRTINTAPAPEVPPVAPIPVCMTMPEPAPAPLPEPEPVTELSEPSERRWVVEPEAEFAAPDGEPDLFSLQMPQRQPVTTTPLANVESKKKKPTISKRGPGRIFDMASRLDSSPIVDPPQDGQATQRQNAHLKTFIDSFKRLKDAALTKGFSDDFLQQYRFPLIGAAAILLICMLTGVMLVFSMTSKPKLEISHQKIQQVAPIPSMYAD